MSFLRRCQLSVTAGLTTQQEVEIEEEELENGEGIAAGESTVQLRGLVTVHAVQLTYVGAPITTTVEIVDTYSGEQVLEVVGKTDAIYRVVVPAHKSSGGEASTKTELSPIGERLSVAVTESDPNAVVSVGIVAS